jgi:hypothetical protein
MVTVENYEEYMMLDADGELDSAGKEALQAFIAANPALKAEYEAWQSLKLQPDPSLVYGEKEALQKQGRKGLLLTLSPYRLAAAAAVVAALALIPVLWKSDRQYAQIVHTFPVKAAVEPVIVDQNREAADPPSHEAPALREKEDQSRKQDHIARSEAGTGQGGQPLKAPESIAELVIASQELLPAQLVAAAPQPIHQDVALTVDPKGVQPESGGLPRIQLAQENRQAFDLLKKAVEARIAQASAVAKSVKETAFVIRLGNGAVNINF